MSYSPKLPASGSLPIGSVLTRTKGVAKMVIDCFFRRYGNFRLNIALGKKFQLGEYLVILFGEFSSKSASYDSGQ